MKSTLKITSLVAIVVSLLLLSACQSLFGPINPTQTPRATIGNPTRTLEPTPSALPTTKASPTPTSMPTLAITPSGPATCSVAPILPAVSDEVDKMIPDPAKSDWVLGADTAEIIIYEYTDYQCQICANLALNLRQLQILYPDDVKIVLRYLPLTDEHDKAALAAQAAEAAGLQDKYWEMHDILFSRQDEWISLSVKEFSTWLVDQTAELELDKIQFMADITSDETTQKVFDATRKSAETTLTTPPALFFNKTLYQDWVDLSSLYNMVQYYKLPENAYTDCPETTIDQNKSYTVTFTTEKGDIVFELYPKEAPMAVNNFVFLARQKWYDNTPFYRVVPGYMVQAGDPTGSGNGRPGYQFSVEVTPKLRFNQPGMLAMAVDKNYMNGSQFFITYTSIPEFDGKFTLFGRVIEGMDVLQSLRPRDPYYDQVLLSPDILQTVIIEEQ
jgi:cyclophilin family peptidyl-prolyl cis-trans isomerase/protein-disulfide isomerase